MYFPGVFKNFLNKSDAPLSYMMELCCTIAPSIRKSRRKGKFLLNSKWKNYFHGLDIFKILNWLMSQYRKTIVIEFFFKAHFRNDTFLAIDFIAVAKIWWKFADIFGTTSFLQEHAPVSSFSQHDQPITPERIVIHFGSYFIYGGHFMDWQCQTSNIRHASQKL